VGVVFPEWGATRVYPGKCGKCLFEGVCNAERLRGGIRTGKMVAEGEGFCPGCLPKMSIVRGSLVQNMNERPEERRRVEVI